MSLGFYMDVHIPAAVITELRLRGVDVVTAQEDGAGQCKDPELLDRAGAQGRVLVTCDTDFLREAARRRDQSIPFVGIIFILNSILLLGPSWPILNSAHAPPNRRNTSTRFCTSPCDEPRLRRFRTATAKLSLWNRSVVSSGSAPQLLWNQPAVAL